MTGYDKPALTPGASLLRDPDHTVVSGPNAGRSHVGDVSGDDVRAMLAADLVILLQAQSAYDPAEIGRRARLLLDTRGVTTAGERL